MTTDSPKIPSKEYFNAPICRNCDAPLTTTYCSECGQKKASRLNLREYIAATIDAYSDFEFDMAGATLKLCVKPGIVAREYVLGARTKHINPLKLLLIAIIVLLVVLNLKQSVTQSPASSKAMEIIQDYSQLSFSLGVIAVFIISMLFFRWNKPYNIMEHIALALYTHFVILIANIGNQLALWFTKLMEWQTIKNPLPFDYMNGVEAIIIALAFTQFFQLKLRKEWWLLLAAILAYILLKKAIFYGYAWLLVKIVIAHLS